MVSPVRRGDGVDGPGPPPDRQACRRRMPSPMLTSMLRSTRARRRPCQAATSNRAAPKRKGVERSTASASAPITRGPRIWPPSVMVRSQPMATPWSDAETSSPMRAAGMAATKPPTPPMARLQRASTQGSVRSVTLPRSAASSQDPLSEIEQASRNADGDGHRSGHLRTPVYRWRTRESAAPSTRGGRRTSPPADAARRSGSRSSPWCFTGNALRLAQPQLQSQSPVLAAASRVIASMVEWVPMSAPPRSRVGGCCGIAVADPSRHWQASEALADGMVRSRCNACSSCCSRT